MLAFGHHIEAFTRFFCGASRSNRGSGFLHPDETVQSTDGEEAVLLGGAGFDGVIPDVTDNSLNTLAPTPLDQISSIVIERRPRASSLKRSPEARTPPRIPPAELSAALPSWPPTAHDKTFVGRAPTYLLVMYP
ncbi:hypothetical protein WME76_22370 [Sorangium sp. So ce119]|uniref:hypothetical protein n=1 Tax=Sorangium sp. So ce119 TaxID=3133279 RepID=UPI003F5ECE16